MLYDLMTGTRILLFLCLLHTLAGWDTAQEVFFVAHPHVLGANTEFLSIKVPGLSNPCRGFLYNCRARHTGPQRLKIWHVASVQVYIQLRYGTIQIVSVSASQDCVHA